MEKDSRGGGGIDVIVEEYPGFGEAALKAVFLWDRNKERQFLDFLHRT